MPTEPLAGNDPVAVIVLTALTGLVVVLGREARATLREWRRHRASIGQVRAKDQLLESRQRRIDELQAELRECRALHAASEARLREQYDRRLAQQDERMREMAEGYAAALAELARSAPTRRQRVTPPPGGKERRS